MKAYPFLVLAIGLFWAGCKRPGAKQEMDLVAFHQKMGVNGSQYLLLQHKPPDSVCAWVRREITPNLHLFACQAFYYQILDREGVPQGSALAYLKAMDSAFPDDSTRGFTQRVRGEFFCDAARFDTARHCLNESFVRYQKAKNTKEAGEAKRLIARTYRNQGNYPETMRLLFEALSLYGTLDSVAEHSIYFNIRHDLIEAFMANHEYQKALSWNKDLLRYCQRMYPEHHYDGFLNLTAGSLAQNFVHLNQPDSALFYAKISMDLHEKHHNPYGLPSLHFTIAQAQMMLGNCQTALDHFQKATCCISPEAYRVQFFKYDAGTADAYFCLGKLDSAAFFYQKCLLSKDSSGLAEVHEKLAKIAERRGDLAAALRFERSSRELHDAVFNAEKNQAIANLNLRFASDQHEKRLAEIRHSQKNDRQRVLILVLLLSLGLVFSLFFVARQRNRRRLSEQKNLLLEKENELAAAREALQKQALERTEASLQAKTQELEQAEQLLEIKNQVVEQLKLQVSGKVERSVADAEMDNLRHMKILTEADWRNFREQFEQFFPGFSQRLKSQFPGLTAAEKRVFMLTKIRFDIQEVSEALGISTESVWKARYRLKKKLGMDSPQDMDIFVQNFG